MYYNVVSHRCRLASQGCTLVRVYEGEEGGKRRYSTWHRHCSCHPDQYNVIGKMNMAFEYSALIYGTFRKRVHSILEAPAVSPCDRPPSKVGGKDGMVEFEPFFTIRSIMHKDVQLYEVR